MGWGTTTKESNKLIAEGRLENIAISEENMKVLELVKLSMVDKIGLTALRMMTKAVLDDFWEVLIRIGASKTGRYHHVHENIIPGGLINHKLRGIWYLEHFIIEEGIKDRTMIDNLHSAMDIHDIGKIYYYEPYKSDRPSGSHSGRVDHGKEAWHILVKREFPEVICKMVKHHMHHWEFHLPQTNEERIICYADYFASREEINIKGCKIIKKKGDRLVFEAPIYKSKV